jgi:hypothetical protein
MKNLRVLILLFCFLSACSTSQEIIILDSVNLDQNSWNGITLGESTTKEFLDMLNSNDQVLKDSIVNTDQSWLIFDEKIWFDMFKKPFGNPQIYGVAGIIQGRIATIDFCGQVNDTIGSIITVGGKPSNIIITEGGEVGGYIVGLVHKNSGLYYWYHTAYLAPHLEPSIADEIEVECVSIFDPNIYDDLLHAGLFSQSYFSGPETEKIMYSWEGYGEIDEKYPYREP